MMRVLGLMVKCHWEKVDPLVHGLHSEAEWAEPDHLLDFLVLTTCLSSLMAKMQAPKKIWILDFL